MGPYTHRMTIPVTLANGGAETLVNLPPGVMFFRVRAATSSAELKIAYHQGDIANGCYFLSCASPAPPYESPARIVNVNKLWIAGAGTALVECWG